MHGQGLVAPAEAGAYEHGLGKSWPDLLATGRCIWIPASAGMTAEEQPFGLPPHDEGGIVHWSRLKGEVKSKT